MQAARMNGAAGTALTGSVLLATAHGPAALDPTRIAALGGDDDRRAAGGDQYGDTDQCHAERSSSATRQAVRAASDLNHLKERSELQAAWFHWSANRMTLLPGSKH
jgi:hypothetical protein